MLLEGRVVIVSGVGPGLGRAIAVGAAAQGADVVLGARRAKHMAAVAAEVEALGRRAVQVATDITDPAACDALVATTLDELGRIDVLVNNAFTDGSYATVLGADLADWRSTMDVNLFGTLHMTRSVATAMVDGGAGGSIVMINTMAVQRQEPTFGAYAASKAALASVTRTLARELGSSGIRVNGVHPGYIWGPPVQWYLDLLATERGVATEVVRAELEAQICLGRIPTPDEIAGTVTFLASDLAAAVTGQAISVNGGHHLSGP